MTTIRPASSGLSCDAGDVNDALGQFDEEKDAVGDQPFQGPHVGGEEVRSDDAAPVRLEKHRPGRAPSSLGCRLEAFSLEDIGDRAAANFVAQIAKSALDPDVAPTGIVQGHSHDQLTDYPHRPRAPRLAPVVEVELASDQLSVPAQQRIGG